MITINKQETIPYVPKSSQELKDWPPFPFPIVKCRGDIEPGWEAVRFVCDWTPTSSSEFQAMLTAHIKQYPDDGYAITAVQGTIVHISAFRRLSQ